MTSSVAPEMVFIDGGDERWRPVGMQVTVLLQNERGSRVAVDERTLAPLALEIDGRRVRDLSQPKASCT